MENIVSTEQMESIKALSDVNIKISEAQNLLFKLHEEETTYLVVREKKAMERIQKVVDDSQEMLKEANKNHGQIKELGIGASEFLGKILRVQDNFHGFIVELDERNVEWEKHIGKQQDDIAEVRKHLKVENNQIENDKKTLIQAQKQLLDDQKKLDSGRGTLTRAIERLKQGKI